MAMILTCASCNQNSMHLLKRATDRRRLSSILFLFSFSIFSFFLFFEPAKAVRLPFCLKAQSVYLSHCFEPHALVHWSNLSILPQAIKINHHNLFPCLRSCFMLLFNNTNKHDNWWNKCYSIPMYMDPPDNVPAVQPLISDLTIL